MGLLASGEEVSRRRFLRLARNAGVAVAGVTASGSLLAACSDDDDGGDALRIGVAAPFSGPGAFLGTLAGSSLDAAVRKLNAGGGLEGRRIELLLRDGGAEPSGGVRVFQELAEERDLLGILWCGAPGFDQILPQVNESGLPLVAVFDDPFSAGALYPEGDVAGRSVFQVAQPAALGRAVLADYAGADRGYVSAALLIDSLVDEEGTVEDDLRSAFGQAGLNVVGTESFETGDTDFVPQLERLRGLNPQVVFVEGLPEEAAAIAQALADLGASYVDTPTAKGPEWHPHVFGSGQAMGDRRWADAAGDTAVAGTVSAGRLGGLTYLSSFAVAEWMRRYLGKEATGGEEAPANGLATLVNGLRKAGTNDRERVVEGIESLEGITFASLGFGYGPDRHVATTMDDMVVLTLERLRGAVPTDPPYELGAEWQSGDLASVAAAPTHLVRPTLEANRGAHPEVMEEILGQGLGTQCTEEGEGRLSPACKVH